MTVRTKYAAEKMRVGSTGSAPFAARRVKKSRVSVPTGVIGFVAAFCILAMILGAITGHAVALLTDR
jgi:hypothetical protein